MKENHADFMEKALMEWESDSNSANGDVIQMTLNDFEIDADPLAYKQEDEIKKTAICFEDEIQLSRLLDEVEQESERTQMLEYMQTLSVQRLNMLWKEITEFDEMYGYEPNAADEIKHPSVKAYIVDQDIMVLETNFPLPYYRQMEKHKKEYKRSILSVYNSFFREAIQSIPKMPTFEQAYILFEHSFTDQSIRDLDNRYYSIVLNILRSTKVIKDDNWQSLTYLHTGKYTHEYAKVRIFISEFQDMNRVNQIAGLY